MRRKEDKDLHRYFSVDELKCKHCGQTRFNEITLSRLNNLRREARFPIKINSAYRCEDYNRSKRYTQTHASGQAIDLSCTHKQAFKILELAIKYGFTGIGVNQKGSDRFIHLDDLSQEIGRPRPHVWTY